MTFNPRFAPLASLLTATLLLSACSPSPDAQAAQQKREQQIQAQRKDPPIEEVGTFDGCTVKYVNRYYRDESFYIAKCGGTTTTTEQYRERSGKYSVQRTRTQITTQMRELQAEMSALDAQERALSKLTAEDRKALGLEAQTAASAPAGR